MKNSDDTATTRTDRVTSPGVVESLRDTAETQTELPSVSGDGVLFTLDSLDGQPGYEVDGIAESVAESADKPVAQAGESAREQPFAIAKFFGRPPLLNHEDWDAYEAWEQTVQAELQPKGLIESLWARDVVHLTWEVERGRRLKKYLLESARPEAIRALVRVRIDDGQVDRAGFDALAAKTARNIWRNDMRNCPSIPPVT